MAFSKSLISGDTSDGNDGNNYMLSEEQFHECFSDESFILKFQQQIAKDFNSNGLSMSQLFEEVPLTVDVIFDAIQTKVMEAVQQGETQLLQLLYSIDIPQQQFLDSINEPDFIFRLSETILRREAYKVFARDTF